MVATIDDAKKELESQGLHVSHQRNGLWIAVNVRESGGIRVADDASALIKTTDDWVAIFPAEGMGTYEMPGPLPRLVATISAVFAESRRTSSPLKDAFRQVVSDPDRYVLGKSLAHA